MANRWIVHVSQSILGPVVVQARRPGRAYQAASTLPADLRQYLNLPDDVHGRTVIGDMSWADLAVLPVDDCLVRNTSRRGGRLLTIDLPVPVPPPAPEHPDLDAYGHLNWTVGNEDWMACFDAVRDGKVIHYHVVVNCESGHDCSTVEHGEVPATAQGIENLACFPDYWADLCREQYLDSRKRAHKVKVRETADTRKRWTAHLNSLIDSKE